MPKTGGSQLKMGKTAWSLLMIAPSTVVTVLAAVLFLSGVIGFEGLGYVMPLAVIPALIGSIGYWRTLDEPSQEAHKVAMLWGMGCACLVVVMIGFEMMFFPGARDLVQGWIEGWIALSKGIVGQQQGAVGFSFGMLAGMFLLLLGYLLVWIGWWASQRIGTKAD